MRPELKNSIITTWYYRRPTFFKNKLMHTRTMPGKLEDQLSYSYNLYRLKGKITEGSYPQILNVVQSSSSASRCLISNYGIHYIISLLSFSQQQLKDKVFRLDRRHKQCKLCQDESLNQDTLISMTILTALILLSKNGDKLMVCPSRFCGQKHLLKLQT